MRSLTLALCLATLLPATTIHAAESGDVLQLEGVTVTAEKQREILARMVKVGLRNPRSERAADVDKVVCQLRKRTGSHLKDLICGTNGTLNYMRQMNLMRNQRVFGNIKPTGNPQVTGRAWINAFGPERVRANTFGAVVMIERTTRGKIEALVNDYAAEDSDEENYTRLVREMVWTNFAPVNGRHGFSADQYTSFALAYRDIKALEENSELRGAQLDNAMAEAITANGLDIAEYNEIFEQVLADEELRARVVVAQNIGV